MLLQAPAASGPSDGTTPMAKAKGTKIAARQQEQVGPPCCPPWVGDAQWGIPILDRVRARASDIDQSYQNHFWYMSNWGYDPSFGDF